MADTNYNTMVNWIKNKYHAKFEIPQIFLNKISFSIKMSNIFQKTLKPLDLEFTTNA